jgi:hypothetical protein
MGPLLFEVDHNTKIMCTITKLVGAVKGSDKIIQETDLTFLTTIF